MDIQKIRYYHLHKQNLLQKAPPGDYAKLLQQHLGLHSTDYLTPYLSLWARVRDFDPGALFNDLNHPLNAIRVRAFRGTLFVVHRESLSYLMAAARIFQASTLQNFERFLAKSGLDFAAIEQAVVNLLSHKNEFTVHELKKQLDHRLIGKGFTTVLRYMEFKGVLVRTSHRYLMDRVIRYGLMEEWFPGVDFQGLDADEAFQKLILKYLHQFGPVCLDDLSWWLPVTKTLARNTLKQLAAEITSFHFNDRDYFMTKEDYHRLEEFDCPEAQQPIINFLPYEDHFPKAYLVRNWFLSQDTAPLVHKSGVIFRGQIFPSIWLNGEIIGNWQMDWQDKAKSAMRVTIPNLNKTLRLSKHTLQQIENRRTELERFINQRLVPLMR